MRNWRCVTCGKRSQRRFLSLVTVQGDPMTEADLKKAVLRLAYAHGWLVYHVPATNVRGSQGRGYPDLTLARGGRVLWIELKQEKGTMREEQLQWGQALPEGHYYVIRPSDLAWLHEVLV